MEQQTTTDELTTVAGGVEMEVTLRDGTKEQVKVIQIPLSKLQQFSMAVGFGNMADAIELYCEKEKGWADTLTYESAKVVMDKGCELNLPFFSAWLKDQRKWRAAFGIVLDGENKSEPKDESPSENLQRPSPTITSLVPSR